jgi:hypothetical protein
VTLLFRKTVIASLNLRSSAAARSEVGRIGLIVFGTPGMVVFGTPGMVVFGTPGMVVFGTVGLIGLVVFGWAKIDTVLNTKTLTTVIDVFIILLGV